LLHVAALFGRVFELGPLAQVVGHDAAQVELVIGEKTVARRLA
jgi:hypothetical protein